MKMPDDEPTNLLNPPGLSGWGYFKTHIGLFYDMGEYGVIYTDTRSPYFVNKVANLDITDGESNYEMADFLRDNWNRDIEGLVKITSIFIGECDALHKALFMRIKNATSVDNTQKAQNVLDLDKEDEILMFRMELLPYLGLNHPDLSKEEMIDRVASAAYNIGTQTGMILSDLKPQNYGFREDGSAAIFDFNLEEGFIPELSYKNTVSALALSDVGGIRRRITDAS